MTSCSPEPTPKLGVEQRQPGDVRIKASAQEQVVDLPRGAVGKGEGQLVSVLASREDLSERRRADTGSKPRAQPLSAGWSDGSNRESPSGFVRQMSKHRGEGNQPVQPDGPNVTGRVE